VALTIKGRKVVMLHVMARPLRMTAQRYEVVVKGRLSPAVIGALQGFEVTRVADGMTTLNGWITDQSLLHGRLEVLRDLNIELVSLNPVPETDR
jgi:hypothetical protein